MVKAQLLAENAQVFHPHLRQTIGQVLYRALIPPQSKVERLLNESIQIAKTRGVQLLVQLKFEEDAVQIARLPDYPWELIHDGTGFLLHNQVGFSRYIAFPAVPPSLPAVEQVNVLLISSGASDRSLGFNPLPKKERSTIAKSLKAAIGSQRIQLEELPEPTLDELAAYLTRHSGKEAPHLLHFDGHGLFGKQCSECRRMHKGIKAQQCQSCSTPLPDAQGYLLFEDEYGDPDYVSASQLGTLLQQTRQSDGTHQTGGVAALVLSACQSGMAIEGESVFQGTAQNLIYHGVPAVVAMQYSVSVEGAIAFAKQFYRSIGEKNSLAVAVSQGRAMMRVDENQWYRPVLYLRWQDNEGGQLFTPSATNLARVLDARIVERYLRSIANDYKQWWNVYRLTEAISARQATFTFEQIVQTKDSNKNSLPLLQGIIQYAKSGVAESRDKLSSDHDSDDSQRAKVNSQNPIPEHVLLIGSPGVGKSTTLLRLLVALAEQEQQNPEPCIPVLVKLKNYQQPPSGSEDNSGMLALIKEALEPGLSLEISEIKALLFDDKRLFLLLDGLNEIPADIVRSKLADFRAKCARAKIPLVCTTRSLGDDLGIERRLELQTLSNLEITRFLRECMPGQEEQVLKLLNKGKPDLGKTPFVLWMLYDLFKKSGQIPESLGEAFRRFTKSYTNYKINQEGIPISKEDLQYWSLLLEYLAFEMLRLSSPRDSGLIISEKQAANTLARFPSEKVIDLLQAHSLLNNLLHYHLLQKSHKDEVSFCHQLIQEYYAAEYLLQQLPALLKNMNKFKQDYLNYLKWTEPIALMLSLPEVTQEQASQLIQIALDVDLMLGARLAGEVQQDWQEMAVTSVVEEARKQEVSSIYEIQLLGNTHSDYAVPILLTKLTDEENQNLAVESALALRELGSRAAIPKLLLALEDEKPFIATIALFILGRLGDEEIIPDLQKALCHPTNDNIRGQAAGALGELGANAVVPDLLNALTDESYKVRGKAVEALGNLRNKSAIPELLRIALEDHSIYLPWAAAEALKKIHQEQATKELLKALKDKNYEIRERAAEALGKVGSEIAIDGLIEALEDGYTDWQAAGALIEIGSKKALPGLFKALERSVPSEQAAFVLGELGDAIAVPSLINVLNHWYPQVRERAIEALGKLGDKAAIPRLYDLFQDNPRDDLRKKIVVALGKLGDERVCRELLEMLESQASGSARAWSGQWQIFEALEKIGSRPVVQSLIQALGAKTARIRWKAAEVLGNLGNEAAIDSLFTALADENSTVRWQAAKALGKFDSQWVVPKLSSLLKHEDDPNIREGAVQVLGYLEDEIAVTALLSALNDSEFNVRYDATQSLVKLSGSDVKLGVSKVLGHAWKKKLLNDGFVYPLQKLQENFKFYNYEIAQTILDL
ncbi:HEAT repeat domain-containing protein [Egbenema bharatensis]|uniref:HEAT repeat domain-containing protein n=1 Tax=Egbenema bharatensis TaxID=3463334 RepID=UPI003A8683B0